MVFNKNNLWWIIPLILIILAVLIFGGFLFFNQDSRDINYDCLIKIAEGKCQDALGSSGFIDRFDRDSNGALVTCGETQTGRSPKIDLIIDDYPQCLN